MAEKTMMKAAALLVAALIVVPSAWSADIFEAARTGSPEQIASLVAGGADVNSQDEDGRTPLMFAAESNENLEVFTVLLEAGADVNARDKDGWTALMLAAESNGNPDVVSVLLSAGANVNARTEDGETALMLSAKYNLFDGLDLFTLTYQTKEVLAELSEPVEVVSFFTPSIPPTIRGYARDLLAEYQNYTDQLTVRQIDPELNPDRAREYGVTRYGALCGQLFGVIAFRSEEGQRDVFGIQIAGEAEHAFTSAILEVTGTKQKKVYFLTGHGESSIYSDYDRARSGLRDNLFQVAEIDLLRSQEVPSDAAALVIAGPQEDLGISELEILRNYLEEGGRLFVLLNPNPPRRFRELLFEWGITIEDGIIVDPQSYVAPNQDTLLVPRTHNYWGLGEVYFPGAASIIPREEFPDDLELVPLAWSSRESWVETDFSAAARPRFDEETAEKGPRVVGVQISRTKSGTAEEWIETQLVVMGDSDFAANQHFLNGNNSDLFFADGELVDRG